MKKAWPFLVLVLVIIVGIYAGYYFSGSKGGSKTAKINNEPFLWGVTMRPHALSKYTAKGWDAQLAYTKELGTKYVRIAWQYDAMPTPEKMFSNIIEANEKNGLSTYMIIESNPDLTKIDNAYQNGYDAASSIATTFKGRIKYYQLLNEAGSVALKGGQYSGEKESDYDTKKYEKVRDWIKGASAGIKKADPDAYRVVTDQWTHFAFLDMIQKDKVDYDIIGWDWFSDMGLMGDKKMADGKTALEHLQVYNKPIILAEVNQRPDGPTENQKMDPVKQKEFMTKMAKWAYDSKVIKGFFILELMDVANLGASRNYVDRYGIIAANKNAKGLGEIVGKLPAFDALAEIIKQSK